MLPYQSTADIPETLREAHDLPPEAWETFVEVFGEVWEANAQMPADEREQIATNVALDRTKVQATEGHVPGWVPLITTGPLELAGGKVAHVTAEYLDAVISEFDRYEQDLQQAGSTYSRPVTKIGAAGPHNDSGRRNGDIVGLVRGADTLYGAVDWNPEARQAIADDQMAGLSVDIRHEYRDPKLHKTYGPHLREVSPTNHPRDKRAGIAAAIGDLSASEAESVGLRVDDPDETPTYDFDLQAAHQGDDMLLSKWLKEKLAALDNLPPGAQTPSKQQIIEEIASGTDGGADMVQALADGKLAHPPDALMSGIADMFEVSVEDLRTENLEVSSKGKSEGGEGEGETPEGPDQPEGGEGMAAGGRPDEDMMASEQIEELNSKIDQLNERTDTLESKNSELQGKLDRYERTAEAPSQRRTPAGDGFGDVAAAEGDEEGPGDILAADTYAEGEDCIARAEGQLGEGFSDAEVAHFAAFKDPECNERKLPETMKKKIRQKHGG